MFTSGSSIICGPGLTWVCVARGDSNKALISDMTDVTITHGVLAHKAVLFR